MPKSWGMVTSTYTVKVKPTRTLGIKLRQRAASAVGPHLVEPLVGEDPNLRELQLGMHLEPRRPNLHLSVFSGWDIK